MKPRVVGLDIGGANLKAADNDGRAASRSFALWREPQRLVDELAELSSALSPSGIAPAERFAVTMTAELCDCFETKAGGVACILDAVETFARGVPVSIWQTGGEFVPPEVAREFPQLVAAANWHALAAFCGRIAPRGFAILLDVGSTTTDVVPLFEGRPVPSGLTDLERLQSGELVYTGVRRTPICALTGAVNLPPGNGGDDSVAVPTPLAAELFATTLDVYLLLGDLPEDPNDRNTANGRPATRAAALDRLARMLCCDRTELSEDDVLSIAGQLAEVQQQRILGALNAVLSRTESPCENVVVSGGGAFLGRRIASHHPALQAAEIHALPEILGPRQSTAACAFAVARLASERC